MKINEVINEDDENTILSMLNSQPAEKLLKAYKKLYKREYPGTSKSELVSKVKSKVRNYKHAYEIINETTSAGAVASVATPVGGMISRQMKNKDGTVKNALDMETNIMGQKKKAKSKKA